MMDSTLVEITDDDVINYLNSYFETFEKKFRKNEVNLQVPLTIISKFKRLVQLRNENLIMSRSLNSNLFREIYDLMSKSFDDRSETSISSAESHIECKRPCNEEITDTINDRKNSVSDVSVHQKKYMFLEFVRNVNSLESFDHTKIILGNNETFPVLQTGGKLFYCFCNICNVPIPNQCLKQDGVPIENKYYVHIHSFDHMYNLYLFYSNTDYLELHKGRLYRCKLCDLIFGVNTLSFHYKTNHHAENYYAFQSNYDISDNSGELAIALSTFRNSQSVLETMVNETDVSFIGIFNNQLVCAICDLKLTSMAFALIHIRGTRHKKRIDSLISNANYLRIDWLNNVQTRLRCFPCGTNFESMTHLLNHIQEQNHLEKITYWQALSNQTSVRCNENLIDLSKFQFNCFACNISCIGFENLMTHYERSHVGSH